MSLSSRRRFRSWPGLPGSHSRGAWFVELAKARLPLPPLPPRQTSDLHSCFVEVLDQKIEVGIVDQGARRDGNDQVLAVGAEHVLPQAVLAVFRPPVVFAGEVQERVLVGLGLEVHVPAAAAIAAVRPPSGHELLPAEADATVAAVAGLDLNSGFVNEHSTYEKRDGCGHPFELQDFSAGDQIRRRERAGPGTAPFPRPRRRACSLGPCRRSAPGKNFVPHCRTRIEPGLAVWPAYIFTPRYCGLLSRPFLEEPCPFLCAMALPSGFDDQLQIRTNGVL